MNQSPLSTQVSQSQEFEVDEIINKLLSARTYFNIIIRSKPNRLINLSESEIKFLCNKSKDIFMTQSVFLELDAPIRVCGLSII